MFQLVMRLEYVKFDVPRPPPGLEGDDLGGRQGDRGPEQTHGVGGSSLRAPAGQQGGSLGSVQQCAGQDRGDAGRGTRGGEGPRERTTDRGGSEVPGAARASGDPFSLLAQGIAQLQSAMSASLAAKATELEVVKPGISELPKLPELSETSCIDIGDWLHALECPMGDISNGSATWWREILASLDRFYDAYLKSSNLDKLSRRPEAYAGTLTKEDRWSRVDKWATSMLLASLPEPIRAEVLASRLTGALQVLGRVMVLYRPGSAAERQQVLRALEVRLLWGLLTQWMH